MQRRRSKLVELPLSLEQVSESLGIVNRELHLDFETKRNGASRGPGSSCVPFHVLGAFLHCPLILRALGFYSLEVWGILLCCQ